MAVSAGKLRHRLVIQKPIITQDESNGAAMTTWQDIASVWGTIEPLSAREFIAAQSEDSKVTARITIRYRAGIDHSYRLYHAAKNIYYNIEGVLADKNSGLEYITLPCSEGLRYSNSPIGSVPVILQNPEIDGQASVGNLVEASTGLWANEPDSYEYQWYLNDVAITGATSVSLLTPNNAGDILTVSVQAINNAGESILAFSDGVVIF